MFVPLFFPLLTSVLGQSFVSDTPRRPDLLWDGLLEKKKKGGEKEREGD